MARAVTESQTGELVAVASRSQPAATAFPREGLPESIRVHPAYEEMLASDDVDVVYVATPHAMHRQWVLAALDAGKHVLCEKSMTVAAWETREIVDAAARADRFLMEGFMYRCHPQTWKLVELLREGAIGETRMIRASFGIDVGELDAGRMVQRELAGGGILDVGCYAMSLVRLIAGSEPIQLHAVGKLNERFGTDDWTVADMEFEGGAVASIECALRCKTPREIVIAGSEGTLHVSSPWQLRPDDAIVLERSGTVERFHLPSEAEQPVLEVDVVGRAIQAGEREAWQMTWADSIGNMEALDRWRAAIGLRYEADDDTRAVQRTVSA